MTDECRDCDGHGVIRECVDDTCRGAGECLYECDNYRPCRACAGSGEVEYDDEDEESPMDQEVNGPC